MTLNDFVELCKIKYRHEEIPEGQIWHDAHHPVPECLGGTLTVSLWESDHAIHNVLQSREQDYPCVWSWERKYLTGDWENLLPEFEKWMTAKARISAYTQPIEAKRKGGLRCAELQKGCHAPEMRGVGPSRSGAKVAQQCKNKSIGIFAEGVNSEAGKVGSSVTNSQKWRCLVTGHVTTSGALANYQKKRNIDTSLRERVG
jgi:hypothetical protein